MACAYPVADDVLECPVCMETMIEPKQLQCGHSLCNGCLDTLINAAGGSSVECPTCRQHSQVPPNGFPTNFPLAAIIRGRIREQEKQCHKCMVCDKVALLDDIIMCHSCGDMSLCWRCAFRSHEGHEKEELENHMDTRANQLEQWNDDRVRPVLKSLTFPSTHIIDKCKVLLEQHQARQQRIWQKGTDFESKLRHSIESKENELTTNNGYKFDIASLGEQLQSLQDQHKESTTKGQELADALSKMLVAGDFSDVRKIDAEPVILLSDGQYFELYSPRTNATEPIDHIEIQKRYGFVLEVLSDGRIMVVGGRRSKMSDKSAAPTLIIDLGSKQVMEGPPMSTGRRFASSTMIGGKIYVSGGEDGKAKTLSSCEVYRNGQWHPIADMSVPRLGHAVVDLDGSLYAIGGRINNTQGYLDSSECYTPATNSWQSLSSLNEPRMFFGAAAFDGCVYAAGGGWNSAQSCERYCPRNNQWETVAPMNKGRENFSLVSFDNKLYALGGDEERSVESYDPEKNEWKIENVTLKSGWPKAVVTYQQPN